MLLSAGNDLNIRQGSVESKHGTAVLTAGNNVNMTEGRKTLDMDVAGHTQSRKLLSKRQTSDRFGLHRDEAAGSEISGKRLLITGKNIKARGSTLVSDSDTYIKAAENVSITAAGNHYRNQDFHETKKSGLMGSGGLGFTIGRKTDTDKGESGSLIHTGSTVGSLNGTTFIQAGKHYEQIGSKVLSNISDSTIVAQSVDIREAENRYDRERSRIQEQKGLTLAVNVPVVSAVQSAVAAAKKTGQSKNDRINLIAAAATVSESYQAGRQLTELAGQLKQAQNLSDAAKAAQISATLTYGEQKNRQDSHSRYTEAAASSVFSGGKTKIIATGAGKDSNIRIRGSDVSGKAGTILSADNKLDFEAAEQTATERNRNKSAGWNAGVAASYGQSGMAFGITAGGNYGKGHTDAESTTHRNSRIGDAGSRTVLQSGGKTTLDGARVVGKGLAANLQDLEISSRQDTARYNGKQQNIHGQVTAGYGASVSGGFGNSKLKADHAAVGEQSGFMIGDEGYNVHVANHTKLNGGVILSSQAAEAAGKNRFSTRSSSSDIHNHSRYEGKSFGLDGNLGISGKTLGQGEYNPNGGLQKVADQTSFSKAIGYGKDGDSQSSVTRSGINTKNIRIGNDPDGAQAEAVYTDASTETAERLSGSLKNEFDAAKVQSELDVQRTVRQQFSRTTQQINTEINSHVKEHIDKAEDLEQKALAAYKQGQHEAARQYAAEAQKERKSADNWQLAGVGVNMLAAGLSAPADSAAGIVANTLSPAAAYKIGRDFKELARANADGKLSDRQQAAHVLAHTLLGAAVAAAGGNDPLAGGLTAGGAEYFAPKVSKFLYGTDDPAKLTAGQKDAVANILGFAGIGVGAALGGGSLNAVQGGLNAENAVENNSEILPAGPIPLPMLLPQKTEVQKEADKQVAKGIEKGLKKTGQVAHALVGAGFGTIFCAVDSDCPDSNPFKAGQAIWNEGMGNGDENNVSNAGAGGGSGAAAGAPMPPDDDKQKKGKPKTNQAQNRQVRDAGNAEGLNRAQQEKLKRAVEEEARNGANLSYQEIREIAKEIKNGYW